MLSCRFDCRTMRFDAIMWLLLYMAGRHSMHIALECANLFILKRVSSGGLLLLLSISKACGGGLLATRSKLIVLGDNQVRHQTLSCLCLLATPTMIWPLHCIRDSLTRRSIALFLASTHLSCRWHSWGTLYPPQPSSSSLAINRQSSTPHQKLGTHNGESVEK